MKNGLGLLLLLAICPTASLLSAAERVPDVETKVVGLTNAYRKSHKKPALKVNPQLSQAAQQHALNMAAQETMAHELDGKTNLDRAEAAGYTGKVLGENVASTSEKSDKAVKLVKLWKESQPHRENMLGVKQEFTELGVGVAVSATGKYYGCQVFGSQDKPRE